MTVRVTVEGGGSFELKDHEVMKLRNRFVVEGLQALVAAALPPEPYQPKEGDLINYREPDWRPGDWTGPRLYLGQWKDSHVVNLPHRHTSPWVVQPGTVFRRAEP